ncbi:MAG: OmpH family outer membrane protein [Bacteroidetes bacterium]|nr:MAG: OmpH family outer membrane protein [Bacteroidota bacterium]
MKKLAFVSIITFLSVFSVLGQRFAYVDTEYILENIPEYQAAQMELNQLSERWQSEIETKFAEIDRMYRDYQAESVLLPEEMRRQREEQIIGKEREAKELQMRRFGREGDLFKQREQLVKPLQDQIYNAIEEIATRGNYAIIFDKAGGGNMIYSDVRHDLSDEVLQKMGYRR